MGVWSHLFGRWVFLCAIFVHLQFSSWGKWPRNLHKHMDSEMTASHCCRCTSWQCCSGCCRCAALQTSRRNLCCSTPLRSTTRSGALARALTRRWGTRTNTVSRGYLVWPDTWSNLGHFLAKNFAYTYGLLHGFAFPVETPCQWKFCLVTKTTC